MQRERWGVKKKKLIEERVPEANAKLPPHLFPLLLFAFSLSLVAKRPTNLDDPAAVSLAELRHFRIDRVRRCTEKKKERKKQSDRKVKKVSSLSFLHFPLCSTLFHSSFLLLSRSSNTASAASAAPASPSALSALLSSSVAFSSS